MSTFNIRNHLVGRGRVFVIAEIGQNHQGDMNVAKELIERAKESGADCVKFQKSCLREKFTSTALNRPYDSVNAWGQTYGSHKEYLEFSVDQYRQLQAYANELDIVFTASAMDEQSLRDLHRLNVPVMKIGSGDANNVHLIEAAARHPMPLIVSTGMQDEASVRRIVSIMRANRKENFCLMHCVSSYPTQPCDVHLRLLDVYRKWFPDVCLGYSGHEEGAAIAGAAALLGAQVRCMPSTDMGHKNWFSSDCRLSNVTSRWTRIRREPIIVCHLSRPNWSEWFTLFAVSRRCPGHSIPVTNPFWILSRNSMLTTTNWTPWSWHWPLSMVSGYSTVSCRVEISWENRWCIAAIGRLEPRWASMIFALRWASRLACRLTDAMNLSDARSTPMSLSIKMSTKLISISRNCPETRLRKRKNIVSNRFFFKSIYFDSILTQQNHFHLWFTLTSRIAAPSRHGAESKATIFYVMEFRCTSHSNKIKLFSKEKKNNKSSQTKNKLKLNR